VKTQIAGLCLVRRNKSIGIATKKGNEMIVWCDAPEDRAAEAGWKTILAAIDNGLDAQCRPVHRRLLPGYATTIRTALKSA
jgi:hypothetical protein